MADVVYGHDLVDHLFPYHPPLSDSVRQTMEVVREEFYQLGHTLADLLPDGPDQILAIRSLHDALKDAIGVLANNQ